MITNYPIKKGTQRGTPKIFFPICRELFRVALAKVPRRYK